MKSRILQLSLTQKILKNHFSKHGNNTQGIKNIYAQWKIDATEKDK